MPAQLLLVHAAALQYLQAFVDPACSQQQRHERLLEMKPRPDDFAKVFREPLVDKARSLYDLLWSNPPPLRGKPEQTVVWVRTATTEDFVAWNRDGQEFPGGYRKLAASLQPEIAWVAWKLLAPGQISGLSFDGLTWLDGRFAWFPQAWRLVAM
jgi:hypothetical protein